MTLSQLTSKASTVLMMDYTAKTVEDIQISPLKVFTSLLSSTSQKALSVVHLLLAL